MRTHVLRTAPELPGVFHLVFRHAHASRTPPTIDTHPVRRDPCRHHYRSRVRRKKSSRAGGAVAAAGGPQPENVPGLAGHELDPADREAGVVLVEGRGVLVAPPRDDEVP